MLDHEVDQAWKRGRLLVSKRPLSRLNVSGGDKNVYVQQFGSGSSVTRSGRVTVENFHGAAIYHLTIESDKCMYSRFFSFCRSCLKISPFSFIKSEKTPEA